MALPVTNIPPWSWALRPYLCNCDKIGQQFRVKKTLTPWRNKMSRAGRFLYPMSLADAAAVTHYAHLQLSCMLFGSNMRKWSGQKKTKRPARPPVPHHFPRRTQAEPVSSQTQCHEPRNGTTKRRNQGIQPQLLKSAHRTQRELCLQGVAGTETERKAPGAGGQTALCCMECLQLSPSKSRHVSTGSTMDDCS